MRFADSFLRIYALKKEKKRILHCIENNTYLLFTFLHFMFSFSRRINCEKFTYFFYVK